MRTCGWATRTPHDQGDPVDESVLVPFLYGRGTHALHISAQIGVDEQHVEAAPLGDGALQTAHGGRAAARRGHVDVRLGGQCGGERFGEDAVVVDD